MVKSLQAGMDTLKADVEAYDALTAKTVELSEAWDESAYADQAFPEYEEYLSGLEDAYENRTFNPLELDSIQPRADRLWISCVKNALINGETNNVTGIMVNPGWDANADGWTKTGDGSYNQKQFTVGSMERKGLGSLSGNYQFASGVLPDYNARLLFP